MYNTRGFNLVFSFIHISDIHLGRPFSDLSKYSYDEKVKSLYNNAVEKAFNNFINYALLKNVDFVLISGDTFDNCEQDFKSKLILKEGLKKLDKADIKVYLICGNHDSLSAYNKNTFNFDDNSNIKIIGLNTQPSGKFIIESKNNIPLANLFAISYTENHFNDNPAKYLPVLQNEDKKLFNIGLIHCDLDGDKQSNYAPCSTGELQALNYDYWALGHIHIPLKKTDNIQYAGTLQGRNTKETGEHGITYIKVENNKIIKNSFIPMDVIRFEDINIDLNSACDITFAYSIIQENIFNFISRHNTTSCELFLIKLYLNGNINFFSEINDEFIETISERIKNEFNHKVYISEIINKTKPETDEKTLSEDDGISGEIYRTITDEILTTGINSAENDFKTLMSFCNFTDEEYIEFKEEVLNSARKECINLSGNIYYNENQKDE